MKKLALITAAVAALVITPTSARAQSPSCTAATAMTSLASYITCRGSFSGNLNGSASELTALTGYFGGSWTYAGKSDNSGNGPFTSNPSGHTSGTITFDALVKGKFVLGVKAGNRYSFYEFDGGFAGILSVPYQAIGVALNDNDCPPSVSHIALYRGPASVVPEPSTYALMGTGLVGLVGVARRRRTQG